MPEATTERTGGLSDALHASERTILIGFLLGAATLVPWIVAAFISGSVTLYTGALRSGVETLSQMSSWLTIRKIRGNKSLDFDFGLGKFENLSSLFIIQAMLLSVAVMAFLSVQRLFHPEAIHRLGLGMLITVLSAVVNFWLWRKGYRNAKASSSPVTESHWRLMRSKFLANVCVLASLLISELFQGFPLALYADPVFSLLLCGFILYSAYGLLSSSVSDLLDRTLEESLQLVIVRLLGEFFDEYEQLHGVRSRRSGRNIFIEIFLEFDGGKKMADVQLAIDKMTESLERHIPGGRAIIVPSMRPPAART